MGYVIIVVAAILVVDYLLKAGRKGDFRKAAE